MARKSNSPILKMLPVNTTQTTDAVVTMATDNPWYGYQRIAVMCRREDNRVTDRQP